MLSENINENESALKKAKTESSFTLNIECCEESLRETYKEKALKASPTDSGFDLFIAEDVIIIFFSTYIAK